MSYLHVENFKFGLDVRRSELTSQLGTLAELRNGHVNQGGEVEKRTAFAKYNMPDDTFGLEFTDVGLITFGSIATPALPAGVTYQRLQHPAVVEMATYAGALHDMQDVVCSCAFGGKAWVVAKYKDGYTFVFYNGVPVRNWTNGLVMSGANDPNSLATHFYNTVIAVLGSAGWTAKLTTNNPNSSAWVDILSPEGVDDFSVLASTNSLQGAVLATKVNDEVPAVNGTPAKATMTVTQLLDDSGDITSIKVNALELLASSVPVGANANATAAAVDAQINAFTGTTGFSSTVVTNVITITAPAEVTTERLNGAVLSVITSTGKGPYFFGNVSINVGQAAGATGALNSAKFSMTELLEAPVPYPGTAAAFQTNIINAINSVHNGLINADHPSNDSVNVYLGPSRSDTPSSTVVFTFVNTQRSANFVTTGASFAGAINGTPARPVTWRLLFTGAVWDVGATYEADLTVNSEVITLGAGNVTKTLPVACLTLRNKVNFITTTQWFFSAIGKADAWEDQDTGAGNILPINNYGGSITLTGIAHYQGKVAIFDRRSVQIWNIGADPANDYSLAQVLENIGSLASLSIQALGDLDLLFLYSTGIRSLRVRDSSLNAFSVDIGSAIDRLLQDKLVTCSETEIANATGIIEPTYNRYLLFLKDTLYVLSYFPQSKIIAWALYDATYDDAGVQTTFVPLKWVNADGVVYARTATSLIKKLATYDHCQLSVKLPFLDGKRPATLKSGTGVDIAISGKWNLLASMDYVSATFTPILTDQEQSTYDISRIAFQSRGTHFSLQGTTTDDERAVLSSFIFHFNEANEK